MWGGPSWTWRGGSRPFPGYSWLPAPYWGTGGYGAESGAEPGGRGGFVEEWKNRDPFHAERRQEIRSIVLSEGLSEDEVVARVGSPLQRIQLGDREVWRYSGYSLLFEKGLLTEIR
ncbi:MAG: hypothetical protein HYX74_11505 [Acidobacteria bacterium]|nr:hypothetical protein [Acidobacteriota bacterium]